MRCFRLWAASLCLAACLSAAPTWQAQTLHHKATADELQFIGIFEFTNSSDKAFEIVRIQSGCGCTVAEPDQWRYEPGESGRIQAQFVYGDRTGQHRMQVVVHKRNTEGSLAPSVLEMVVDIPQLVEFNQRLLLWRADSDPTPQTLTFTLNSDLGVELSEVVAESDNFMIRALEITDKPGAYSLTVQPKSLTGVAATSRILLHLHVPGRQQKTTVNLFLMIR